MGPRLVDATRWSPREELVPLFAEKQESDSVVNFKENRAKVRKAEHQDSFGILDTLIDALNATETPLPDPSMPYAVQALMDRIAVGNVAVAEAPDGRIVGCVVLNTAHWPWVAPHDSRGCHLFNEHFWVDPKWRRGGIASKLVDYAKNVAAALRLPLMLEISCIDGDSDLKDHFVRTRGFKYLGGKFYWGSE